MSPIVIKPPEMQFGWNNLGNDCFQRATCTGCMGCPSPHGNKPGKGVRLHNVLRWDRAGQWRDLDLLAGGDVRLRWKTNHGHKRKGE